MCSIVNVRLSVDCEIAVLLSTKCMYVFVVEKFELYLCYSYMYVVEIITQRK